jgi:hypothetical protein
MMTIFSTVFRATVVVAACATGTVATASEPNGATVTEGQVRAAHQAWGDALVQISTDFAEGGIDQAKATAVTVIDTAYGYNLGPVLFKPTLTQAPQTFRTTADGALAYFVGQDTDFPEDKGFALNGWTEVTFEDAALFISGDTAMWMGNVHITDASGAVTTVDKTFGYQLDEAGDLRIVLHHSSLPFSAD